MSLFRQLLIANSQKKKRPYYCEVEYLEGTGTQYINTGLVSTEQSAVDVVFGLSDITQASSTNGAIFGGRNSQTNRTFTLFYLGSTSPQYFRFDFNGQVNVGRGTEITIDTTSKYEFKYENSKRTMSNITTNETVTAGLNPAETFTTTPIILFAVNTNGGGTPSNIIAGTYFKGRIYKYKYSDGVNTIDLIPVLDWDMVPCMYDKVSGELLYNAGTGEFSYGREIHQVEYLESTGTQYIDTGYSLNTNTDELSIDYTNTSEQNYKWVFGEYETNKTFGATSQNITNPRFAYRGLITAEKEEQYYTRHTLIANSDGLFNDGIQKSSFKSFEGSWNIYLFALNNTGTSVNGFFGYGKIYSYVHKRNGSFIRDFIPAVDENGVGFMFDRVSHTIFDNAGTGAFVYPPVELEYLESSGTQYIDTGIIGRSGTLANVDFEWLDGNIGNDKYILGSASTSVRIYFGTYQSKWQYGYFGYLQADGIQENTKYNAEVSWLLGNGYVNINDERIITSGMTDSRTSDLTLYLFARHQGNSIGSWGAIAKIYNCKIYQDDALVRDFMPALKDGQLGMWDKVNKVFYPNNGTGTFIGGRVKEDE